jgi:hypothetical protein
MILLACPIRENPRHPWLEFPTPGSSVSIVSFYSIPLRIFLPPFFCQKFPLWLRLLLCVSM